MTRFVSLLTLITFAWTSLAQAFPHVEISQKSGFRSAIVDIATAHNPVKAAVDSAIQSTVIGSIGSLEGAEGNLAKGLASYTWQTPR